MINIWTDEDLKIVKENWDKGRKYIQENFFPHRTLDGIKHAHDSLKQRNTLHKSPWLAWSEQDKQLLKDIWVTSTMEEILQKFPNRSYSALKTKARKLDIKRPTFTRLGTFEPLFFDTPETYYWLGFFMADGNLTKKGIFRVWTSIKDHDHTKKFADLLKTNMHYDPKRKASGFAVCDKLLAKKLREKYDISNNKTYNPPDISQWCKTEEKFTPFITGFIDGDGTIRKKYNIIEVIGHGSWINNFELLRQSAIKYWPIIRSSLKFENRGLALLTLRIKSLPPKFHELNLPVLDRKWSRIT